MCLFTCKNRLYSFSNCFISDNNTWIGTDLHVNRMPQNVLLFMKELNEVKKPIK